MKLKRITTKDGEVYFVDSVTGERVKTQMDTLKNEKEPTEEMKEKSCKNYEEESGDAKPKEIKTGARIVYVVISLILIAFVTTITRQITNKVITSIDTPSESTLYTQIEKIVNETNKKCPIILDTETRLDRMEHGDKSLSVYYTLVKYEIDEIDMDIMESNFKSDLLNNIKTYPDMKVFKDLKFTFIYNYNDKYGRKIITFKFTPHDYL